MAEDIERRYRRMTAYNATHKAKKERAQRNAARRQAIREGKATKGDGTHVHHKKPIVQGGTNAPGNLEVVPAKKNQRHGLTKRPKGKSRHL